MSSVTPYIDFTGRRWPTERLDSLLSDSSVLMVVEDGVRIGASTSASLWCPFTVKDWAECRYRRREPAALLTLLVWRFFELCRNSTNEGGSA